MGESWRLSARGDMKVAYKWGQYNQIKKLNRGFSISAGVLGRYPSRMQRRWQKERKQI